MFKKDNLPTIFFIFVILALIILAIFGSQKKHKEAVSLPVTTNMKFDIKKQPLYGDENAPISLAVYYDYKCPHCYEWEKTVLPVLEKATLAGKDVNLRFINYAFMDINSQYAAMASEMVYDKNPKAFLDFHEAVFSNQMGISIKTLSQKIHDFVPEITVEKAKEDLLNGVYMDQVLSDKKYAQSIGVQGTPAISINGKLLNGNPDFANIQKTIDKELSKIKVGSKDDKVSKEK